MIAKGLTLIVLFVLCICVVHAKQATAEETSPWARIAHEVLQKTNTFHRGAAYNSNVVARLSKLGQQLRHGFGAVQAAHKAIGNDEIDDMIIHQKQALPGAIGDDDVDEIGPERENSEIRESENEAVPSPEAIPIGSETSVAELGAAFATGEEMAMPAAIGIDEIDEAEAEPQHPHNVETDSPTLPRAVPNTEDASRELGAAFATGEEMTMPAAIGNDDVDETADPNLDTAPRANFELVPFDMGFILAEKEMNKPTDQSDLSLRDVVDRIKNALGIKKKEKTEAPAEVTFDDVDEAVADFFGGN